MRARLAFLLATASCQWVFPLADDRGDAGTSDSCSVQQHKDPLRYRKDTRGEFPWAIARANCAELGMQLAVFDTMDEFTEVRGEGTPPYWIGVNGNSTEDGCPPSLVFGPGQPLDPLGCVTVDTNLVMERVGCGLQELPTGGSITALCEAPRPSAACAAIPAGPYSAPNGGAPVPYATAAAMCNELVEFDSFEEIALAEQEAQDAQLTEFWIRPRFSNGEWLSPSNCPSLFPWNQLQPAFGVSNPCAVYRVGVGIDVRDCTGSAPVLCEH